MSIEQEDTAGAGSVFSSFSCDVDTTPSRDIRRRVRTVLGDRDDIVVDDAVLVADELVTNALRHAEPPRRCRIALTDHGQRLRIEVDDATSHLVPQPQTPDRSGGRGLVLLDRLASAWGVDHRPGGKTMWADLALDRPGSGGHARHLTMVPAEPD